jgi:hypothetical protein
MFNLVHWLAFSVNCTDGHCTVYKSKQLLLLTYNSNFYILLLLLVIVVVVVVAAVLVSLAEYFVKYSYILYPNSISQRYHCSGIDKYWYINRLIIHKSW